LPSPFSSPFGSGNPADFAPADQEHGHAMMRMGTGSVTSSTSSSSSFAADQGQPQGLWGENGGACVGVREVAREEESKSTVPGTRQGQRWELKMVLMLFLIFKLSHIQFHFKAIVFLNPFSVQRIMTPF
jgi:hypothetical protein